MSPGQISALAIDGRADHFSLAAIAFEMLAGAKPFQADTRWRTAIHHARRSSMLRSRV
jgi:hypothetical protein